MVLSQLEVHLGLDRLSHTSVIHVYFPCFSRFLGCKIRKVRGHRLSLGVGNEKPDCVSGDRNYM